MSEPNTGELFSSLLSNPAMLSGIAKLLSSTQSAPQGNEEQSDTTSSAAPDMSGLLSAALSSPQLIAALPDLLRALSTAMPRQQEKGADNTKNNAPSASSAQESVAAMLPLLSPSGGYKRPPKVTDRRSALLLALKPYMSHDKAEMIDTIVRIIEIMTLIK